MEPGLRGPASSSESGSAINTSSADLSLTRPTSTTTRTYFIPRVSSCDLLTELYGD